MRSRSRTDAPRAQSGATLLEAIVAITLLGMIGLSGLALARSAADILHGAARTETEVRAADDFLNAVSLWSRTELDQRLGEREQGPWRQEIQRISPDLYLVTLRDSSGISVVLRTALFRDGGQRANP